MARLRLLLWGTLFVALKPTVAGDLGLIRADTGKTGSQPQQQQKQDEFCVAYNSEYSILPTSYDGLVASPLADYSHVNGCSDGYHGNISGMVVAVSRGNCTFVEKAAIIQAAGGVSALVVDYPSETSLMLPGGNASEYNSLNISVAIILHHDFTSLMGLGKDLRVWLYAPSPPSLDPNIVVLFTLATLCVVTGAYLSASHYHRRKQRRESRDGKEEEEDDEEDEERKEESVSLGMGIVMSVGLVIFFCASLTLLYFFYDYLVYVIMAIFSVAGVNGLFQAFLPLWKRLLPCDARVPVSRVPCMRRPPQVRSLFLVLICAAFVAVWIVFRHHSFAWILQDIIGFCFCLYIMRALLMPSLRACTVLLVLLFVYDIFFVFITPLFTKNGESVMIKVATGGNSKTGEQMPTVFRMPYFVPWAMSQCFPDKYSLLGYGDIIVPGLLVTYNCAFDLRTQHISQGRWKLLYFTATSVAYCVGLVMTGGGLYLMKSGQPALLYLVPCTVLTTVVIAACRGELTHMWRGHQLCPKKDDDARAPAKNSVPPAAGREDGGGQESDEDEGVMSTERQSLIQ